MFLFYVFLLIDLAFIILCFDRIPSLKAFISLLKTQPYEI